MESGKNPIIDKQSNGFKAIVLKQFLNTEFSNRIEELLKKSSISHARQSLLWAESYEDIENCFIVLTMRGEQIYAYSLVRERSFSFIGKSKYFIDGGPVLLTLDTLPIHLEHVLETVQYNGLWLKISPYITGDAVKNANIKLNKAGFVPNLKSSARYLSTVTLNLETPIDEIRASFRRSLKTQLNKAIKLGIEANVSTSIEDFSNFIQMHNDYAVSRGFSLIKPTAGIALFNSVLKTGQAGVFVVVKKDNQILGGLVLLASGDRVIYEWGVSSQKHEHIKFPIGHIMQWTAINWGKEQGFKTYDFGGYWLDRGDDDPINRFKTGFSKNIQDLAPEHHYYCAKFTGRLFDLISSIKNSCLPG